MTYYLLEVRGLRGPIVKSVTTTRMVRQLAKLYGVPWYETSVGFKYLGPKMMETDAIIAGEESGGYAFRGHLPESATPYCQAFTSSNSSVGAGQSHRSCWQR